MNKRKVALFQRIGWVDHRCTWSSEAGTSDEDSDETIPDGYVRLSPWLEIEFPTLGSDDVINAQLAQLDKAEQKAREELQQKLNAIDDTRRKILALAFNPAA
ncbi:MAG: hypothetical protein IRZ07_00670 [Microbispora sp.]|nr:hypothetical protein [Microbispora sp.]